ncbi:DUF6441 family protein [Sphingomonas naphthae]|uniref:DUF6441 family protein n=1 Tax=Sphingomonas naphthae TaxID=1813468 RepID=A0ABY7TMM3_9SPHN|nr:DUF6441 family protein [Sphingomonas naphthae]WCT73932.1 DUF6441 family protein [Sphingomonas naphthae]
MAAMKAMQQAEAGLKEELRDQVLAAGFSERFAKTWQGKVYPTNRPTMSPAAYVFSKAPSIIDAYARGVTIVARAGRRLLAIPTEDAPRKRSGGQDRQARAMTPIEVEARYGQRLRPIWRASAQGSQIRGRAVGYLVMDGLVKRDRTNSFRRASAAALAGKGRSKSPTKQPQSVVMFTLVASVKVPKKLDLQGALDRAAASLPQLLDAEWSR